MNSETVWITKSAAGEIAPGLAAAALDRLRRDARYTGLSAPPAWVLSDGEVLYDELAFRRWLESTVRHEWVYGFFGAHRPRPVADRLYAYQDADLQMLRRRTYIDEGQLLELIPDLPLWKVRDLRFRAVGPRFLKPTPRTVIYIAEEARDWAAHVNDYSDPTPDDHLFNTRPPYTPPRENL